MGRTAIYKKAIKENTIKDMKKLGVFKREYIPVISVYSELIEQYNILTKRFLDSEYTYFTTSEKGGNKKDPLVSTLESLRKDILQFASALCLTPKSLTDGNKGNRKPEESPFSIIMKKLDH